MTHKDIYTKFMIEYDKANVTSSYPSLTEYEVATVLDKAYNALIAQKVTGNNVRRVALEGDLKAITDIQGLVKNETLILDGANTDIYTNVGVSKLPSDYLYFISGSLRAPNRHKEFNIINNQFVTDDINDKALDHQLAGVDRTVIVKFVNHQIAEKFMASASNIPWIKNPVAFVEGDSIYVVIDPIKEYKEKFNITYIKKPNKFVKDIDKLYENFHRDDPSGSSPKISYFEYDMGDDFINGSMDLYEYFGKYYEFECNDTVAEELISLAVAFALENVESQRLNSKLNMRGLEA